MKVYNPSGLPTIDYREAKPLQGDLKDLTKTNYAKLKRVLDKRGFTAPLFLWKHEGDFYLMDGHQRQRVMLKEDMQPYEVPYVEIQAKSLAEAKEILLELTSQYGTITQQGFDSFTADLPEFEALDVNFDALSFIGQEPEIEEDAPPEISDEPPISKLGEIYQLGRHRLMCGDSTEQGQVNKLFSKATIAFTSPPYNASRKPMQSERKKGIKDKVNFYNSYNDNNIEWGGLLSCFQAVQETKTEYQFINLQFLAENKKDLLQFVAANATRFVDVAFWKKSQVAPAMADNVMNSQVECIWIFTLNNRASRAIGTANFHGTVSNFIETNNAGSENKNADIHGATMPVDLASHFVTNFTKPEDSVYDAFIGTGTTLIACEQTDRICYGMELDPRYVDVIRKRYHKFINDGDENGWEKATPKIERVLSGKS